ncbi:MAG: RNA-binding protein [Chloroflexi bacterium]|nr:RNA-binding protein [Chloroflexota bacterium]
MGKKLYVGNLSYNTTEASLKEFFTGVGQVESVNLITDRMSGRSRGFGFVEMESETVAQAAISQLNGRELDGRSLKIAEAKPQQRRDGGGGGGGRRDRY